jgi:hypothetical protein
MGPFIFMGGDEYTPGQAADDDSDGPASIPASASDDLPAQSDDRWARPATGSSPWGGDEVWGSDREEQTLDEGNVMQDRWGGGDRDLDWGWGDEDEF